jgi:hypothetical protein
MIIYDNKLPYEPCKSHTNLQIQVSKPKELKMTPPKVKAHDKFFGFTEEEFENSLFWSIVSIFAVYGCKIPSNINDLRKFKLKDQTFNNNHMAYRNFLQEFENGKHTIDKDWIIMEALAKVTYRPIIILSSLNEHKEKKIFKFNHESIKPPIFLGTYRVEGKIIFTPYKLWLTLQNRSQIRSKVERF